MNKWRRAHKQRLNRRLAYLKRVWAAYRAMRIAMIAATTYAQLNMIRHAASMPVIERVAASADLVLRAVKAMREETKA